MKYLHNRQRGDYGVPLRLFITCWVIFTLHFATNTVREIYPALSLGDDLSFDVSEYVGLHPDIFVLPGRGAYINNNPGASILAAIPYSLVRPAIQFITELVIEARAASAKPPPSYNSVYPMAREFYRQTYSRGLDIKFGLAAGVMQALLMAPLSALSAVVIYKLLFAMTTSSQTALWLALLYAFATPVFYRTAQLNHNMLVGHFALFSFALLWRWNSLPIPVPQHKYFLAGLLAGWTVVLDYSGVIALLGLGFYALLRWMSTPSTKRANWDLVWFALGSGLCVAVLLGYQWHSFGDPLLPAQHYMPETTYSGEGYRGMNWPQLDLLWELAFGIRYGLFISAPLLLLALYPPGWLSKKIRLVGDAEAWFIFALTVGFFLFTAANQFSRMQFNTGVRHVVPVTPFLFLLAAGVLLRLPSTVAIVVGAITLYWSWCLTMYRDVELGYGIFESLLHITFEGLQLPWLTTLHNLGYMAYLSPVPLLLVCTILLWILWGFSGAPKAVRLARTIMRYS
jgi:hypothetical protein